MGQKRNTVLLAVSILFVALGALFIQQIFMKKEGGTAIVQIDGRETHRLKLQEETEISLGEDGYNKIVVKDGAVAVTEADCPDQVCVRTGWIRATGEVIACLPHELIITIEGVQGQQDAAVQ